MAKSIRSAIKKRFRSQKRSDRISVEDQRLARLSARLEARQKAQAASKKQRDITLPEEATQSEEPLNGVIPMEIEQKKISTSGPRGSARETWKGGRHLAKKRAKSVLSDRQRKRK